MTHPNNERARQANRALRSFRLDTIDEIDVSEFNITENEMALVYLLADIRHLCDAQGWNFGSLDRRAYKAYSVDLENDSIANEEFAE